MSAAEVAATLAEAGEEGDIIRAHGLTWTRIWGGSWACWGRWNRRRLRLTARPDGQDIWSLLVRDGNTKRELHRERCPTAADLLRRAAKVVQEVRP